MQNHRQEGCATEAERRVADGQWYAQLCFASVIAAKSA